MFRIRPALPEDYYDIRECLEQHGKELRLTPEIGIMTALENGFAGLGMYRFGEGEAELTEVITVDEDDEELAFFIGKAVLNKLDLAGVKQVTCRNGALAELLRRLEFLQEESGRWKLRLEGYFTAPCQRKKV